MSNNSTQPVRLHGRRDMLRIGALGFGGLSFGALLEQRAVASNALAPRAKSCILLWLDGGPSHLETFDMKPEAPVEVRGPFQSIATKVSGIHLCEHLPKTAAVMDQLAIIRSLTSPLGEHGIANQYLLTGYKPSSALTYPSYGAVVSLTQTSRSMLPPYIAVPASREAFGPGYLGDQHAPFPTGGDPSQRDFRVRDLNYFPDITAERIGRRQAFLAEFDRAQAQVEATAGSGKESFAEAFRLTTSREAKQAFDLSEEPASLRARYGPRMFGQSCLLARRLVERGVPFVSVLNTGWDTHDSLVLQLRDGYSGAKQGVGLIPTLDAGLSTLIGDLRERGMLDDTLVIAMGEFGRTPKLNSRGGRDHWPRVFSAVLAGGGIRGGQVIGSSDRVGESPRERAVTPADLARTLYTLLGIAPDRQLQTPDGRPVAINQGGNVISELM